MESEINDTKSARMAAVRRRTSEWLRAEREGFIVLCAAILIFILSPSVPVWLHMEQTGEPAFLITRYFRILATVLAWFSLYRLIQIMRQEGKKWSFYLLQAELWASIGFLVWLAVEVLSAWLS